MDPHRAGRLAEAIREELYELINFQLADPRIQNVEIAAIELSPDKRKAVVRIVAAREETLAALEHAKGFLRKELAATLDVFRVPDLRFEEAAPAVAPGRAIGLLKRMRRGRPRE